MTPAVSRPWLLGALFLLHALPFAMRPALIGGDEVHYALMAHSIAVDGDFELADDYAEVAAGSAAAGAKNAGEALEPHLREVGGRSLATHSVGLPLIASPLLLLLSRLAPGAAPDLALIGLTLTVTFVALRVGWALLAAELNDSRLAAVLVFGSYFSSPLWFYSRTFFTEPYLWSFAVLAVGAIRGRRTALGAVLLGLLVTLKATAILFVLALLAGALLLAGPRRAATLALGPLAAAAFFAGKNLAQGLPWTTTSQSFQIGSLAEGLRGLLFDAEHGLLVFAPFVVVLSAAALPGLRAAARRSPLVPVAATLFGATLILHAAWLDWRGGSGYGPRLIVPALPVLVFLASTALPASGLLRRLAAAAFLVGFTLAWCAALSPWRAFWGISALELVAARPLNGLVGLGLAAGAIALHVRTGRTGPEKKRASRRALGREEDWWS